MPELIQFLSKIKRLEKVRLCFEKDDHPNIRDGIEEKWLISEYFKGVNQKSPYFYMNLELKSNNYITMRYNALSWYFLRRRL